MRISTLTSAILALLVVGCTHSNGRLGDSGGNGGNNGGTGGTGGSNSSTGGTTGSSTGGTTGGQPDPNMDPNCGEQDFMLQKGLPPDLLIILDRSGSMSSDPGNGMGTKWDQVTAALNQTVAALQGQIKWGLETFPSDNDCGVSSTVNVTVGANNAAAIASAISMTMPNGSTPTTAAIKNGTAYLQSVTDSNPKYMLLATDGEPNCSTGGGNPSMCTCPPPTTLMNGQCCLAGLCIPCPSNVAGGPDEPAAEQAVVDAASAGVHTFVVGIATDSSAEGVLNQMAQNGLEARPGTQKYYPVTSSADLVNTINTIAGQIISCSFALQMAPDHLDYVSVEVDGVDIPRDTNHQNGWDYGPNNLSIQFYGSYCTQLQTGGVMNVKAVFGCSPVG
jgi:hypothetical protein